MRKLALMLIVLLVLVLGTVLIAPSLMDWNTWRDDLAARIETITGRAVDIDGSLSVRILPRPALEVEDVRLANIHGGSTRHMLRVGSLSIHLAWAPLVRGVVRVTSVEVIDPVLLLERLPDGRANWLYGDGHGGVNGRRGEAVSMAFPAAPANDDTAKPETALSPETRPSPSGSTAAKSSESGLTVALEDVQIRNGLIEVRDTQRGIDAHISVAALDLSAESLRGPYRLSGDVTSGDARGTAIAFDALVGEITDSRPAPLDLQLLLPESGATATLSGTVSPWREPLSVRGDLQVSGPDLATATRDLAQGLPDTSWSGIPHPPITAPETGDLDETAPKNQRAARAEPLPPLPHRPFSLSAQLTANAADGLTLEPLRLSIDSAEARGRAHIALDARRPKTDVTLKMRTLDLDTWAQGNQVQASGEPTSGSDSNALSPARFKALWHLPTRSTAHLSLLVEAIAWRGEVIRQMHLDGTLKNGRVTIQDARANLPGAGTVSFQGTLDTTQPVPNITGHAQAEAGNLREILIWMGIPVDQLPTDRLRGFTVTTDVDGGPQKLKLSNLDMTVDTTRATGAVILRSGARLGVGANIHIGSLNLDAYRPARLGPRTSDNGSGPPEANTKTDDNAGHDDNDNTVHTKAGPVWSWLTLLNTVDANARLRIDTLTVDSLPAQNIVLSGSLMGGRLTLQDGHIGSLAGTEISLAGGLSGFGRHLHFHDLSLTLDIEDPVRTARMLRTESPKLLRTLGPVTPSLSIDGPADALDVTGAVHFQGGSLDVNGTIRDALTGQPSYDLSVDLRHPDAMALGQLLMFRANAPSFPLASEDLASADDDKQPVTLVTRLGGEGPTVTLVPLDVTVGDTHFSGGASLGLDDTRPHLVADLTTDRLDLPMPPLVPWPDGLDVDLTLRTGILSLAGVPPLPHATLQVQWAQNGLTLSNLIAGLANGSLTGTGTAGVPPWPGGPSPWSLDVKAWNVDVGTLLRQTSQDDSAQASGTATFSVSLHGSQGTGASDPIDLTTMTGEGTLSVQGLHLAPGASRGSPLAAVLRPVSALDQATQGLLPKTDATTPSGAPSGGDALTTLDAHATLNVGILTLDRFHVQNPLYEGTLAGTLDLAAQAVTADGTLTVTHDALRDMIGETIPVRVFGPLADPAVRASFQSLRIPSGQLGVGH